MKFTIAATAVCAIWTVGLVRTIGAEQAEATTTWSGVYTDAQATAGEEVYRKTCSECHLDDLAGDGFAPALKGPEFMNNWNSLSVGDLFERIRISMPPGNPGALTSKEKSEVIAFILKSAGFPAGTTELANQTEALKGIKFEAIKPGLR
ncbi:MAG: c-type cytochrome [Acidobacteriota bacterium]